MSERRARASAASAPEPQSPRPETTPDAPRTRSASDGADAPQTPQTPQAAPGESAQNAQIEQVAARTGLTKRTLRYYEEIGLLDPPTRTDGGYRLYSEHDIARLELIKRWRGLLGFTLSEIRELVGMEEERQQTRDEWSRVSNARNRLSLLDHSDALARRTLSVVEDKIAGLEEMRTELRERLERHRRVRPELQAQLEAETPPA